MPETTRRGFLELSAGALAFGGGGGEQLQLDDTSVQDLADEVQTPAVLLGPRDARPAAGSEYFDQWVEPPELLYVGFDGSQFRYDPSIPEWTTIRMNPETQVGEVRTEDYKSFFNHTFARPESPDTKNWLFDAADITKDVSEIELASTASIESTQRGNYPPGTEAIPGCAFRVTSAPSSGRGDGAYFDSSDGFGVGEDSTDSYVFIRKGGSEHQAYRSQWNGHVPKSRVWVDENPVITRFPHLFYGGGAIRVRALLHSDGEPQLRTLHTFTPDNVPDSFGDGAPFDQPNLPITFESSGLSGGALRANAAHYEFGESDAENRVNGEHFSSVDAGASGWTPLIAWRKRSGWEMVNVKPLKIEAAASGSNANLALQLAPELSGGTWELPTNTSSSETAVEVNTGVSLDTVGERRWVGYVTAGQGNRTADVRSNDLTFNLPANQAAVLVAQGDGGTATLSGDAAWEEMF